jgi:imidazolonepropionase
MLNVTVNLGDTNTGHIFIRGARQVLTLRGAKGPRRGSDLRDLGMIQDGSVLVRDGTIQQIGPTRRIENLAAARDAIEINATGRVVMPGFVDCHTHLIFPSTSAGAGDDESFVRAVRTVTCQRLQSRAQTHMEAMARHGTTTVEGKTGCGLDLRAEIKLLRVLAALKKHPLEVVPTFLLDLPSEDHMSPAALAAAADCIFREFLPKIRRRRFACFADLEWHPDPVHQELYRRYLAAARELGYGCKIHACQLTPAAAIRLALEFGAVSIDHLEHATAADAAALAGGSPIVTLLPYASFCAAGRHAPGRAFIDAGAAVALGSNFNCRHTPTLNMQSVVALACMWLGMTPAEAISAATINGAHALGRADRIGSLELGKSADLVILNVSDFRELAHHFGTNLVHMTMKRGEFIYEEGRVVSA